MSLRAWYGALMNDESRIAQLPGLLLDWFARHRRPLPWRAHYSPYATWIAEIMLQQTQMDRGVDYFNRWMERFPTIESVAQADDDALLKAWEGLGYYRRVRNLKAAAQAIMTRFGGKFPEDPQQMLSLPGIGAYTAGAIASTAFNLPVPCVDGNVERVLSRVFDIDSPVRVEPARSRIRELAAALIPPGKAREFNQALMEFGALVCRKKPDCADCPVAAIPGLCQSLHLGIVQERPVLGRSSSITPIAVANGVLIHQGRLFIQRREEEGVWGGLWEFPGGCMEPGETPEMTVVREWREEVEFAVEPVASLGVIRHGYTTYRVTMHCFALRFASAMPPCVAPPALHEACEWKWISPEEVDRYPMPAPHRKLADWLQERWSPAGWTAQAVQGCLL